MKVIYIKDSGKIKAGAIGGYTNEKAQELIKEGLVKPFDSSEPIRGHYGPELVNLPDDAEVIPTIEIKEPVFISKMKKNKK